MPYLRKTRAAQPSPYHFDFLPKQQQKKQRVSRRAKGRGSYGILPAPAQAVGKSLVRDGAFSDLGERLAGKVEQAVPKAVSRALGSGNITKAGKFVGNAASKVLGFGSYHISKNTLVKGEPVPTFCSRSDGTRICHREFVADIRGSTDWTIQQQGPISATNHKYFPWLSQVAENYETFNFDGLIFEYRPTSGMIGGSTAALGSVVMATDYNVHNPPFPSKRAAESYEFSSQCVPFEEGNHGVECAPRNGITTNYYCGNAPSGADPSLYSLGSFQLGTSGMPSDAIVGELWAVYDVRLLKPRIDFPGSDTYGGGDNGGGGGGGNGGGGGGGSSSSVGATASWFANPGNFDKGVDSNTDYQYCSNPALVKFGNVSPTTEQGAPKRTTTLTFLRDMQVSFSAVVYNGESGKTTNVLVQKGSDSATSTAFPRPSFNSGVCNVGQEATVDVKNGDTFHVSFYGFGSIGILDVALSYVVD